MRASALGALRCTAPQRPTVSAPRLRARCAAPAAPRARAVTFAGRQRRCALAAAASNGSTAAAAEGPGDASAALPRKARDAIALGLQAFAEKEYDAAADLFQLSLTLPGSGAARRAGSPTEYAVPSDGEAQSALYNLACCFAAQGRAGDGLEVIKSLLEAGYEDTAAIRGDADLAPLRAGGKLDAVLAAWDAPLARVQRSLAKKKDTSNDRKWLTW